MSPEQVRGETVDGRADIYGLGCVLFKALTGDVPFPREETHAIYFAHLEADPPICSECNSSVPPSFDDVVVRALAKSPEHRYASARDFEVACHDALARSALSVELIPSGVVAGDDQEINRDTLVLVRQVESGLALIHRDEACPALAGAVSPPRSIEFAGPGTAGWISYGAALDLSPALCDRCIVKNAAPSD
jgi:serine/threonine protein kinase